MPVLMVAAYDENDKVNVMNVAWIQICGTNRIFLCIGNGKKTLSNILKTKAFIVSLADETHMDGADYFDLCAGNSIDDKFERTGYTAIKNDKVNAPIIEEFPLAMECELLEEIDTAYIHGVVGRIRGCGNSEYPHAFEFGAVYRRVDRPPYYDIGLSMRLCMALMQHGYPWFHGLLAD